MSAPNYATTPPCNENPAPISTPVILRRSGSPPTVLVVLCRSFYAGRSVPVVLCRSFCAGRSVPVVLCRSGVPQRCRSGVEPPTGTIHPRESRGTEVRKQESKDSFRGMPFRIWNYGRTFSGCGAFRSEIQPPTAPTRPAQKSPAKKKLQKSAATPLQSAIISSTDARKERKCARSSASAPQSNPTENFKGGIPP